MTVQQATSKKSEKLKVFISYSRADMKFADELVDGLELIGGFDVTIDRHSIKQGEEWEPRLGALIEAADTVVFILSPDSANSEICQWEVDEAERLEKRLLPVLHRSLGEIAPPRQLGAVNYIDFTGDGTLMAGVKSLSTALKEDLNWLKESTRLLNLALDWERAERRNNRLLSGQDIVDAKQWMADCPKTANFTELHRDFIKESELQEELRKDEERQRLAELAKASELAGLASKRAARRTMVGLMTAIVLAVVAGWLGWQAYLGEKKAQEQTRLAEQEKQRANRTLRKAQLDQSKNLSKRVFQELMDQKKVGSLPALLAMEVLPDPNSLDESQRKRPFWRLANEILLQAENNMGEKNIFTKIESVGFKVASSADGQYIISGSDNTIHLWSVSTGREVKRFDGHAGAVVSVAFSADGNHIISGGADKTVRLWSISTGREEKRFLGHESLVSSVAFSADGQHIVSGSWDQTVRLWDVETGEEVKRFKVRHFESNYKEVTSVAFSADGQHIIGGSGDSTMRLWSVATGEEVKRFEGHESLVSSVAFSADGQHIISGSSDNTVRLWSVATGREVKRFEGHKRRVDSVAFSADGQYIVSGSWDKTVRLWDVATGREVKRFEGHKRPVTSVAFIADGQHIVSGSADMTNRLWQIPKNKILISRVKNKISRCLTKSEREAYFLSPIPLRWCITGAGLEREKDPAKWQPKPPYNTKVWKDWLIAKDAGKDPQLLPFEIAQKIEPLKMMGAIALGENDYKQAITSFTEVLKFKQTPGVNKKHIGETFFNRAQAYMMVNQQEKSIEDLKWAKDLGHEAATNWLIAKARGEKPLLPAQIKEIEAKVSTLENQAEKAVRDKLYQKAIQLYNQQIDLAQQLSPKNTHLAAAFFNRAKAMRAEEKYNQAIDDFQKAKKLGKKQIDGWIWWTKMFKASALRNKGKTIPSLLLATSNYLSINQQDKKNYTEKNFQINFFTRLWQSSYPLATHYANHKQNRSKAQKITECDQLASHPYDPFRLSAPIQSGDIDLGKAKPACDRAVEQNKHEPRYYFNRARVLSKMAEQEKDKSKAIELFKAMHADLDKAMSLDYPMAFNNKGYAYSEGEGVVKDEMKEALLNLETFNRIVHCCALSVSQHLMKEKDKHDLKTVYKVVKALLRWAVALKAEGAAIYLEDLYEKNVLARSPALPTATFKSVPPWLKYD